MLTLAGSSPEQAQKDATGILAFETALAKASMPVTDRRDPEKIYHLQTTETFYQTFPEPSFTRISSSRCAQPEIKELNNANPAFISAMIAEVQDTDLDTLKPHICATTC